MGSWAIHGKDRQRCDARAKHKTARAAGDWRTAFRHCRNWAVPGKRRCRLHGGLSTGPKTPEGKAAVVAAMQKGRRRRIAELAEVGLKIRTGRRRAAPELSPAAQRIKAMVSQLSEPSEKEQQKAALRRKLLRNLSRHGRLSNAEARAYTGVKTDQEMIERAIAELPALRRRLIGST